MMQDPMEALAGIRDRLSSQEQERKRREQEEAERQAREAEARKASKPEGTGTGSASGEGDLSSELRRILEELEDEEREDPFAAMMPDVRPMIQDTVRIRKDEELSEEQIRIRRRAAENEPYREKLALSMEKIHYLDPAEITGYRKEGVLNGVFMKVKHGEYRIMDYIDLHHRTLDQARTAVDEFLSKSFDRGYRFVIIIHGKGDRTTPKAQLKSFVFHWLKQAEPVLAFHHAMPYHGGAGATYVLIRKNRNVSPEDLENALRQ